MQELLVIAAILLLLFGASRLPQLGSSIGAAIRNFKKGFSGDSEDTSKSQNETSRLGASSGSTQSSPDKSKTHQS